MSNPMNDKYLTIVYEISDRKAFKDEMARIQSYMGPREEDEAWAVSAWSRDHELHRLDLIEDALLEGDVSLAQEIIGIINIGDHETLDCVRNRKR